MSIHNLLTERKLIIINLTIVFYFILIYLINLYKIDYVIIGVFWELLTIPFLIGQIVFLVLSVMFLIKNKHTSFMTKISVLLLAICFVITISSFF